MQNVPIVIFLAQRLAQKQKATSTNQFTPFFNTDEAFGFQPVITPPHCKSLML